ncbi:hypothetical protein SAMN05443287_11592 [Micromonospora phaseoli]|uniref:Uncharacterized protein n=1 Tax=Micromonospora phaseoli TaxID=1144548 RepID=A0A1H7DNB4_9ACTN|nr:hypothetical protein [Micromonospora phaseoli]PZV89492.1 hypothetical protein CLV64_11593 [Micromonospora phaseoli]GIJ80594.1 hypothetical protein Xph01_50260 [Micromonospora phaseoli]SEK03246.1 hypothetical protein SAMN05443287_11592 [Micromonospora phaseoli]
MTAQGVLLVTAVVWAVSLIRPVRWRAFVASLPLPMSAALLATGYQVDGGQLVGVVGLNLFFGIVLLTHHRLRWPILLADLAGIAGYLAVAAALGPVALPLLPTLAGVVLLWLIAVLVLGRWAPAPDPDPVVASEAARLPAAVRLLLILAGATLTGLLGQVLRGLVVTFPYAGVLVAVEVRRELPEFCRHFVRNSLALIGFLAGVYLGQEVSGGVALALGWAGFGLIAAALHLPPYLHGKRSSAAVTATGSVAEPASDDGKR